MAPENTSEAALAIHRAEQLAAAEDFAGAAEMYRAALKHHPLEPKLWNLLGLALLSDDQGDEALQYLEKAAMLAPDRVEFRIEWGIALQRLDREEEAIAVYHEVLDADSENVSALTNIGVALLTGRLVDDALHPLEKAVSLAPDDPAACANLGVVLQRLGRTEEAIASFETALAADPDYGEAWSGLGVARHDACELETAVAAHDKAVAIDPDNPGMHWNLAMSLLLAGDYARGFEAFEWRRKTPRLAPRTFEGPEWDGGKVEGLTVLVHVEQGIGDAIQFARYVPLLAARGARIAVAAHWRLADLFRTLEGAAEVVSGDDRVPDYDLQVPLLSLPRLFETGLDSVPAEVPYLAVPPDAGSPIEAKAGTMRVGLVWAGNPRHANDRNRSCPFAELAPLFDLDGIEWVGLQVGERAGDATGSPVRDLSRDLTSFAVTAAAIEALDLVISVDTAVAHLAGALARPVWLLLPAAPDWRWLTERTDSPWYPTMRLFRQSAPGDWPGVVGALREAVAAEFPGAC